MTCRQRVVLAGIEQTHLHEPSRCGRRGFGDVAFALRDFENCLVVFPSDHGESLATCFFRQATHAGRV